MGQTQITCSDEVKLSEDILAFGRKTSCVETRLKKKIQKLKGRKEKILVVLKINYCKKNSSGCRDAKENPMAYKPRLKRTARAEHVITQILVQINDLIKTSFTVHSNVMATVVYFVD